MKNRILLILVMGLTVGFLSGCGNEKIDPEKGSASLTDPLDAARQSLYSEIGIEEKDQGEKTEDVKTVAPGLRNLPPVLPAVDGPGQE